MNFERLIELASEHQPDTSAAEWGFSTRLEAGIRELRQQGSTSGNLLLFSRWLWRTSLGLVPVAILLAWFLGASNGFSLPDGADGVVGQITALIPGAGL